MLNLFFNPQKAIVFRKTFAANDRTDFYLVGGRANGQVGDRGIFRLTATGRDDRGESCLAGHLHGLQGFGECANLVDLHQDAVGGGGLDASPIPLSVGCEQVIPHQLHSIAKSTGQRLPTRPILFGQRVLDTGDRILIDPVG